MKYLFSVSLLLLTLLHLHAQTGFEGSIDVYYTNSQNSTVICDIMIKGDEAYLKQNENGNSKYDRFVINLKSRELFTVSTASKKVIIKYQLDSLLNFYQKHQLKENFEVHPTFNYKNAGKTKHDNGREMTKFIAETDTKKVTVWEAPSTAPLHDLIPFLRLLGNWNEADGQFGGQIFEATVSNRVSKKETTVKVTVTREPVAKEMFILPKTYLQKDFGKLMNDSRNNPMLTTIIQTFAEF